MEKLFFSSHMLQHNKHTLTITLSFFLGGGGYVGISITDLFASFAIVQFQVKYIYLHKMIISFTSINKIIAEGQI